MEPPGNHVWKAFVITGLAKPIKLRRLAVKATEKMINVWTYQT